MEGYFKTCALCSFHKFEEWPEHLKVPAGTITINMTPFNIICSNPKSPYYEGCIIGSWGCVFSSTLSPELMMPDGRKLKDL